MESPDARRVFLSSKDHNSIVIRRVVAMEVRAGLKKTFVLPHLEIVRTTHFLVKMTLSLP